MISGSGHGWSARPGQSVATCSTTTIIVMIIVVSNGLLPYFCTNRRHFNFFIQTEQVLTPEKESKMTF